MGETDASPAQTAAAHPKSLHSQLRYKRLERGRFLWPSPADGVVSISSRAARLWLGNQSFEHPAQQIAFQTYINAMDQAYDRKSAIERQILAFLPEWSLGPGE
jgi:hypothetical protein